MQTKALFTVAMCLVMWNCKMERPNSSGVVTPLGKVDQRLEEASGLVASVANPGFLWTINDSGNPPEVFLIDLQARTRLVCTLVNGHNRDWEDIAIGAGPQPQKKYLYVADIGDNWAQNELKYIYRFEEPVLTSEGKLEIVHFDTLTLKMPDGKCDAETLLIDPLTNDLFLFSKRVDSAALYTTHYPFRKDIIELQKVMVLPYGRIVAGSISQDGTQILLKNYEKVFYWKRTVDESLAEALRKIPIELPYEREHQGEAIAWSDKADGFYTLSEGHMGQSADLLMYKLNE